MKPINVFKIINSHTRVSLVETALLTDNIHFKKLW